jgi:ArsR family transcriptional regulator
LREVERTLRPGGALLVVEMRPHEREDLRHQMGHVWLGFEREHVERLLAGAGLERTTWRALPADPLSKGPSLFVASARKRAAEKGHWGGGAVARPEESALPTPSP